jgi:hypothetical protein
MGVIAKKKNVTWFNPEKSHRLFEPQECLKGEGLSSNPDHLPAPKLRLFCLLHVAFSCLTDTKYDQHPDIVLY